MNHNHLVTEKADLNPLLIAKQGLKNDDLDKIVDLHRELHEVFDEMVKCENDIPKLRNLTVVVKQLEFDLQEAWGFDKNEDWHSWWFQVPYCSCPNLDNWDLIGTQYRIISEGCPVHASGESNGS